MRAAVLALALGCATSGASSLRTLDGKPFSLASAQGRVVLLDFWATWCEPCKATLPAAQRIADQLGPKGLQAYAVNVEKTTEGVRPFLDALHVSLSVLNDPDGVVAESMGGTNLPFLVLLDRGGKVRFKQEGAAEGEEERVLAEVKKLLAE